MIPYGAQSMTSPLEHVLVKRPGPSFGAAFDDPAHGYRWQVDLAEAEREHDAFASLLESLGVAVHDLGVDTESPDLIYQYDPALVTDRGAVLLRSGKPNRRGEEDAQGDWFTANGIPVIGRIEPPGTVDGGDVFWLRPDVVCIGRSLRTNRSGIEQLIPLLGGEVHVFDVPYDAGPDECLHLLSVISPLRDDLAVVELPRLPSGLHELLLDFGVEMLAIPQDEVATLACNVLTVRPGVAVVVEGSPATRRLMEEAGVEVHSFYGHEICINGSGGPTCLTRPLKRA